MLGIVAYLSINAPTKIELAGPGRKKPLVVRVYEPTGTGKAPVVVFSHGFGANEDAFEPICQNWAKGGYVVLSLRHEDADKLSGGAGRNQQTGTLRDRLQRARSGGTGASGALTGQLSGLPEQSEPRIGDVMFLLDHLDDVQVKAPALKGRLDTSKIAMTGHSFGGFLSMAIGGVRFDTKSKKQASFLDPRVKALIPISAAGIGEFGLTAESWKDSTLPTLYISGTKDTRPGHPITWRRDPFEHTKNNVNLLTIEGANHFSYGGRFPTPITRIVEKMTLAFLDQTLKGQRTDLNSVLGSSKATLESKK